MTQMILMSESLANWLIKKFKSKLMNFENEIESKNYSKKLT